MQTYRLYRLDGAGNITAAEWIVADSDDDALRQAEERNSTPGFELWEQSRRVVPPAGR